MKTGSNGVQASNGVIVPWKIAWKNTQCCVHGVFKNHLRSKMPPQNILMSMLKDETFLSRN